MEKDSNQEQEDHIEMVNINSIKFNSNCSAKIANPKSSSIKVVITVPFKIDIGSEVNLMPLYIHKKLFPRATLDQFMATRDTNIKLKMYNQKTITQLSLCGVKIEHNNKHKMCNFFVVPGNGQALLCIPHIEILNILTISCNRIGTEEADKDTP